MATVTSISLQARAALQALRIHYEYGYGDVYHFSRVPGTSSIEIDTAFTIDGTSFVVRGETLYLAEQVNITQTMADTMTMPTAIAILRHVGKCVKEGWSVPPDGRLLEQVADFLEAEGNVQ